MVQMLRDIRACVEDDACHRNVGCRSAFTNDSDGPYPASQAGRFR